MADFQGYLLKIEGAALPNKYIVDFSSTPHQAQDKDSYQDITGELHREILPHTRTKIEFNTPPLFMDEKQDFQSYFPDRKIQPKINVEYWDDEYNCYTTGTFYTPDIQYKIKRIAGSRIEYKQTRIALIEY